MKSKFLLITFISTLFLITGCRRTSVLGELSQCLEYASKYGEDAIAFSSNQTKANCERMKSSLSTYIKKCDFNDASEKADLQKELDDEDCSQYN